MNRVPMWVLVVGAAAVGLAGAAMIVRPWEPVEAPVEVPPVSPPAPSVRPEEPPPKPARAAVNMAIFRGDHLLECITFEFVGRPDEQARVDEAASTVRDRLSVPPAGHRVVSLDQGCEGAFSDRVVWGSCVFTKDRTADRVATVAATRIYDFGEVYDSDFRMQECVDGEEGLGGNWTAMSRDTSEWRRARRQYELAKLTKQAEDLEREYGR